ncbi:FG-GAP-like repeat-containing protein [Streptomyces sp. NBC_00572]|uniref:FG-GAP-like repeat-containing protein n=1 Tax=Streptomyces sp. NBC_00572 TaxID=2903664 RepID=UPI002251309A|nr:FG-GAP-like repeat-containing protein [Streptomyces sp. NBC_00572]MCX4983265.1 FG-GAP-like repeat-containing protein [Streptomyces sp. NBC_00572]
MRPSPSARLLRGALTAGLALGLSAAVLSSPARAADGADRCPQGSVCVFSQPLFQGDMLIVKAPMVSLGAWDNRIRSFVNNQWDAHAVCFYPKPGLDPEGSVWLYNTASFDESQNPGLDKTVSSIDIGAEADDFCGGESRYPTLSEVLESRPTPLPATGAFGDIDRDGYADVLSRDPFGQLWSVHDTSPYAPGTGRLVGGGWNAMTKLTRHGDQDGDGDEDVYARDGAGSLWLYPGDGKGAFKPRRLIGGGWNSLRELTATGDLTGDAKGDLLAVDATGVLWTYPGNGKGWFDVRRKVGGGWKAIDELVGAGDMNSDRKADLVARDTAGKLWLYPGNGRGWFGTRTLIGSGGWNAHKELAGLGDITGDGRPDLVAHVSGAPFGWDGYTYLLVYPGTGDGRLRAPLSFGQLRTGTFVF